MFLQLHFSDTSHIWFLQYLSKIKIQQIEKDRGEWDNLSPEARREKEAGLQMFGQLARFHNIMSNETIGTLTFLTSGEERMPPITQQM